MDAVHTLVLFFFQFLCMHRVNGPCSVRISAIRKTYYVFSWPLQATGEWEGQYLCSGLRESVSRQLKYSGSMVKAAAMAVWFASSSCLLTVLFTMMSSPKSSSSVEGSSSSEAGLTPKAVFFLHFFFPHLTVMQWCYKAALE